MTTIMDGKKLAKKMLGDIRKQTAQLPIKPGLAVIIAGDNPASRVYVDNKKRDCAACGIHSHEFALPADAPESALLQLIGKLNAQPEIHGILVQLPLPPHIAAPRVVQAIDPAKDVDCFHMHNVGRVFADDYGFLPCTPAGVVALLDAYAIDPMGKHCVVVGASAIVGKPMALMMLHRGATVTVCHIHTTDLAHHTAQADILIVAVGKTNLITADMVRPGAVVVDVGINPKPGGGICGDVDFAGLQGIASHITPVPGGVGPMTRAMLMHNTLQAAINKSGGQNGIQI